jgi:hypothetical protein
VDEFGLGYALGLLAAEGSFTGDRNQPSVELKLHRRDVAPLEHLQRTFGGKIFGPYDHGGRHVYAYMLRGADLRRALPVIESRLPASWKRTQLDAWRSRYAEYFDRPRASAALLDRLERLLPSQEH